MIAIDLFCGKGGWTLGLQAAGWQVIGFDVENHGYPGQLVLQDVLTVSGRTWRNVGLIVASPPCQLFSYRAMPWCRLAEEFAPALCRWDDDGGPPTNPYAKIPFPDNALFNACFRIQREASEAAGHHVPMVVENVKGAQPWVGRAKWHYGSFYLWGDVPALMPATTALKNSGGSWFAVAHNKDSGHSRNPVTGDGVKIPGQDWNNFRRTGEANPHWKMQVEGVKQVGSGPQWFDNGISKFSSGSAARKEASARIAMIPFALAKWIGEVYLP